MQSVPTAPSLRRSHFGRDFEADKLAAACVETVTTLLPDGTLEPGVGIVADATALARGRGDVRLKLVHGYRRLALAQIDGMLCLHVELSVPRITRHFFPDPTGEVEFLIHVPQLNFCKHYTI